MVARARGQLLDLLDAEVVRVRLLEEAWPEGDVLLAAVGVVGSAARRTLNDVPLVRASSLNPGGLVQRELVLELLLRHVHLLMPQAPVVLEVRNVRSPDRILNQQLALRVQRRVLAVARGEDALRHQLLIIGPVEVLALPVDLRSGAVRVRVPVHLFLLVLNVISCLLRHVHQLDCLAVLILDEEALLGVQDRRGCVARSTGISILCVLAHLVLRVCVRKSKAAHQPLVVRDVVLPPVAEAGEDVESFGLLVLVVGLYIVIDDVEAVVRVEVVAVAAGQAWSTTCWRVARADIEDLQLVLAHVLIHVRILLEGVLSASLAGARRLLVSVLWSIGVASGLQSPLAGIPLSDVG